MEDESDDGSSGYVLVFYCRVINYQALSGLEKHPFPISHFL